MILDDICAYTRTLIAERKHAMGMDALRQRAENAKPPRDFRKALRQEGMSVIAEVKKASPSKGRLLPEDVNPVDVAAVYEMAGARAISVLTEPQFFKGHPHDLTAVRDEVTLPCLRKDFIIDPYQIYEARALGADAILLIVRILSDGELQTYHKLAVDLGMSVLVETHNSDEIKRARDAGAHIIGINNRDLATFETDIDTTLRLKKEVPGGYTLVSESGIHTRSDIKRLEGGGVDAVLIGEALVTSGNIQQTLRSLLSDDEG